MDAERDTGGRAETSGVEARDGGQHLIPLSTGQWQLRGTLFTSCWRSVKVRVHSCTCKDSRASMIREPSLIWICEHEVVPDFGTQDSPTDPQPGGNHLGYELPAGYNPQSNLRSAKQVTKLSWAVRKE